MFNVESTKLCDTSNLNFAMIKKKNQTSKQKTQSNNNKKPHTKPKETNKKA